MLWVSGLEHVCVLVCCAGLMCCGMYRGEGGAVVQWMSWLFMDGRRAVFGTGSFVGGVCGMCLTGV